MSAPRQERPLPAPSVIRRVEPTTPDAEVADSRLPLPFYDSQGMPRRQTLSPEEYQVLLRRRAWLMRQHAIADESMLEDRPLLRLLRR